jgi:hypothetical protein
MDSLAKERVDNSPLTSNSISLARWLDLVNEVEDLVKRVADTEDAFVRRRRAQVQLKLAAIKKDLRGY